MPEFQRRRQSHESTLPLLPSEVEARFVTFHAAREAAATAPVPEQPVLEPARRAPSAQMAPGLKCPVCKRDLKPQGAHLHIRACKGFVDAPA